MILLLPRVAFIYSIMTLLGLCVAFTAPAQVELTGQLMDREDNMPLAFAAIGVYASPDSTLAGSTTTLEDGTFSIEVKPGIYYVYAQFLGYDDLYTSEIKVKAGMQSKDIGAISMTAEGYALEEVQITAERSTMEMKLDRRVFNVGKDLANAGNSAADILDNVPSVTVDAEGNVSLRGSQSVRILVNGKPSGLISAGETDALLRMQGDIIESVEVITNPSARYEAEGEAGILNIILKKNKEKGVNGSFSATAGYPENFGGAYNLNFFRNDFNFFSSFGIDYRRAPGGGESSQRFFENDILTEYYTSETNQIRGGLGGYLQVGTDWNIDEYNTLTGSVLYRTGKDDNDAEVIYRDFNMSETLINKTVRDIQETETDHNVEASLLYKKTFDTEDREWTVDFKYILDDDTEIADYDETADDRIGELLQRSSNTEDEINILFQSDYVHPIGENSKFEAGLRAALRTVNNDFLVEEEMDDGDFVALPNFNDRLEYTEDIYAAYVIGAHEFGAVSMQVGLRAELSDITAALLTSDVSNDQDYLSLFPSGSISYEISEQDQLQASYSRRISRPYFRLLLPFSNYNNPRNNYQGNPNLQPEFTDVYELGYLHYFPNGSILNSAYYRRTTGVIQRIIIPFDDATTIRFPVNLSERNSYGFESSLSYELKDGWDVNMDINLFRSLVEGQFEEQAFEADAFSMNGRISSQLDIGDDAQVQVSFNYRAPENTAQGRRLSVYNLDLAASVDIMDGKGTITLSARDIFNTRIRRTIIDQPDYQSETEFQWRRRQGAVLTFNYRLNKEKRSKEDLLGNSDR